MIGYKVIRQLAVGLYAPATMHSDPSVRYVLGKKTERLARQGAFALFEKKSQALYWAAIFTDPFIGVIKVEYEPAVARLNDPAYYMWYKLIDHPLAATHKCRFDPPTGTILANWVKPIKLL